MGTPTGAGREFWRPVLLAGGFTTIPRWTLEPATGVAEHQASISGDVASAVRGLAGQWGVPASAVLLAAHAKVLAALSGEGEVVTGYVAGTAGPLPARLSTDARSWRGLVEQAARVEAELLAHTDFPVAELAGELGVTGPLFETVFDPASDGSAGEVPAGDRAGLPPDTVLRVGIAQRDSQLVLRVRYRTEVLDAGAAARIAGYHRTALELMTADPDGEHARQTLLSEAELRYQLDELIGAHRELPPYRFHELFEQQVAAHPDRVAAAHGQRRWTYQQLNERANQLAHALLAHGLRHETVVAVVTERNLDWLAAVLAIFKAGGVYLPIEPHFPSERIATTLRRANCQLVLTEPGSTTTLDRALDTAPDVQRLFIDAVYAENYPTTNPGVPVAADQLAYIYFTSGSTGQPKGAMCEHAGMLNHLYAKIDALDISENQVVAQTAPQCFDISLWQLISALLVGGQTLLIEQEIILDVARFVEKITQGRVGVLQLVPSYLEAVVTHLEQHPQPLPDLHGVSTTGEALKKELTQRWFAINPHIRLVNAYGLTETSDDTNHEVMYQPPTGDRVPLGPCSPNMTVYVVDDQLNPVPLGAPGLIVYSGICVGRGYVNDPERTAQAYLTDPHREGQRLYLGGDYGRWQPDGKLDFLGRRDSQVKISGFRIEIGEIENKLLRVPGLRDGAVVVTEHTNQSKHLVAFYTASQPLPVETLRDRLGESLPDYMIPAAFHWRDKLPLTPNSKIDRKVLSAQAAEIEEVVEQDHQPPTTPTEQRIAAAWSSVLGIPLDHIGRNDNLFDRGGTSLSAVKLAIALDRAVSLSDLTHHPILADLAALIDGRTQRHTGLLQPLTEAPNGKTAALVCFPYAGGNAVNFQPMAKALRDSGLAVYAVELPGHDLAGQREPFAPLEDVVEQVVTEITQRGLNTVLLWGHSSGTAFAIETANKLQERGVDVRRVFLAAQLLGDVDERRAAIVELNRRDAADIAAELSADSGYTELGELDAQRTEHVGAAYRHDCVSAHEYFVGVLDCPPSAKLSAPVTVVVAADDRFTAGFDHGFRNWQLLAEHAELCELADGGHYFLRTRPVEAAGVVSRFSGLVVAGAGGV